MEQSVINKIPTAEEFMTEFDSMRMPRGVSYQKEIGESMNEFAELHAVNFAKWLNENYYSTYGDFSAYRKRQAQSGALVDPTKYSIEDLFKIYTNVK